MNEFNIGNYNLFSSGISTVNICVKNLTSDIENITSEMNKLNSQDVFAGPICENVIENWNNIVENSISNITTLGKVAQKLSDISLNYQNSDNKNASNITSV